MVYCRTPPTPEKSARRNCRSPFATQLLQGRQAPLSIAHIGIGFIPSVARQNRRNHAPDIGRRLGVKNDALKAAPIPRLDKSAEGIDAALERRGKVRDPVDFFAAELSLQCRRGQARRFESNRHAGGKNWTEKLTGIAKQGIARSAQRSHVGRIANQLARRGVPARPRQQTLERRRLAYQALQFFDLATRRLYQVTSFSHYAERCAAVGKRNQPIP